MTPTDTPTPTATPTPFLDLTISRVDPAVDLGAGTVTYTVEYRNLGTGPARAVFVVGTFAGGTSAVRADGWRQIGDATYRADLGGVPGGAGGTRQITVTFGDRGPGAPFGATFRIDGTSNWKDDVNPDNDIARPVLGLPTATPTAAGPASTPPATATPGPTAVAVTPGAPAALSTTSGVFVGVPAEAVTSPSTLEYQPSAATGPAGAYDALVRFGLLLRPNAGGAPLSPAVQIVVRYDAALLGDRDPSSLAIAQLDADGIWIGAPTSVDVNARTASALVPASGDFALVLTRVLQD
jgi:uncharacterized repeat protein (TIGR01451 family)